MKKVSLMTRKNEFRQLKISLFHNLGRSHAKLCQFYQERTPIGPELTRWRRREIIQDGWKAKEEKCHKSREKKLFKNIIFLF